MRHYRRWWVHGDTSVVLLDGTQGCSIEGCSRKHAARDWCIMHWKRWWKHGDPLWAASRVDSLQHLKGADNPNWTGDDASYKAIHRRLERKNGSASGFVCLCGEKALHWSYDHLDPNEKESEFGPYSTDLDRYQPRCVPCHVRLDRGVVG